MTFLVDTNVLVYALADPGDVHPNLCDALVGLVGEGEADGRTSVVVLEEVWHLELRRRPLLPVGAASRYVRLFTPLLAVDQNILATAMALEAPDLGSADRILVATCLAHGIEAIVTADDGFRDVAALQRVDPFDGPAMERLLG